MDTTDKIANSTVPTGSSEQWKDNKRYLWLIGLVVPSLAFAGYAGWHFTGVTAFLWLGPVIVLGVVPAIDLFSGLDRSNPPDDAIEALEQDTYYRWITYLFLPIQYAGFVGAMYLVTQGDPFGGEELSLAGKIGLSISIGVIGGIGINTAHELGHKREENERWLSKIALAQSFYGHFYIEHNRGHHVRVATPEDPASSRMGENFYQFWPRTVGGSLKSAWSLEKKRYARRDQHPFRLGNDVLNAWVMSLVLFGAMVAWLGLEVLPFLIIQAVVGFSLLEVVNFMEHYGMLRQKVGRPGKERYERVDPSHSWNSNNIATNVLLYHLQRHSDHHANPTRRYQTLRDFEESPVLPTGYAGMIVLALIPPVYRRVMDKRVVAHFNGDLTLANLQPSKRAKILKKYGLTDATPVEVVSTGSTDERASLVGPVERRPEPVEGTTVEATTPQTDEPMAARCPGCGYTYEVEAGNELQGFAAGTAWADIPRDWCCPDCGVREAEDFIVLTSVEA